MEEKLNRRERKKIHSKNAILSAAIKLFAANGYKETSIADIMNEADLGTGTFYNYFSSKEEILKELLRNIVAQLRLYMEQSAEENKSAAVMLTDTLLLTADILEKNRFVQPLFLSAVEKGAEVKGHTSNLSGASFRDIFNQIVRQGQLSGEFRDDVPAAVITELFHSILQTASFSSLNMPFRENVKYKLEIVLGGMKKD